MTEEVRHSYPTVIGDEIRDIVLAMLAHLLLVPKDEVHANIRVMIKELQSSPTSTREENVEQ